jgi:lipoyl(octanoyl) transferase
VAAVRVTAIDSGNDRMPEAHIFVRSVAAWETLPEDGLPRFDARASSRLGMNARAHLIDVPGLTPYGEAFALQRSLAAAIRDGLLAETVILLEHEPVITLGRRTDEHAELHLPDGVAVEIVETNRGGKSTYHGPGQLVCYPILDLNRHGRDLKQYVRDLEAAIIRTVAAFGVVAGRIDGLTGVWLTPPPRKICSIGVHASRWVTTHGYALNVDLDPAPFTEWITACGLEDAQFTTMARELRRPVTVDEVRPVAAAAISEVFGLALEELRLEDAVGVLPAELGTARAVQ